MARSLLLLAFLLAGVTFSQGLLPSNVVPWAQINLAPFQAWTNSNLCLQNTSSDCPTGYLNETGTLNVAASDAPALCSTACLKQINVTFDCINKTTKGGKVITFRFNNKAYPKDVITALNTGCSTGNFTVKASK